MLGLPEKMLFLRGPRPTTLDSRVMVFDPPWDQSRMSEEARVALDMW